MATVCIQSLEVTRNGRHVHLMGVFHAGAVPPGRQLVLPSPAELPFNARITHYSDDCTQHYLSVTNAGHVRMPLQPWTAISDAVNTLMQSG